MKMKHVSADIPESLHRAVRVKLASEGRTLNDLVREFLVSYVESGKK